ncbi:hypothetical protein LIP_1317 [Limnochorda pilosa]|uniref:AAA+ ATPase domain-containing protein n=2 Tax=Limnochorda pilosa TaxID=1555112 RepID=A0A0K2SJB4_LIMPI|nr:hypothetical protein LIP_1317 [Limnochorda pilosa]
MGAVRAAAAGSRHLILFEGVIEGSPLLRALAALLGGLAEGERAGSPEAHGGWTGDLWALAAALARQLLDPEAFGPVPGNAPARSDPGAMSPSPWHDHLVERLLADDNAFTRAAARADGPERLTPSLQAAAVHDLRALQALAALRPSDLEAALRHRGIPWPERVLAWSAGTGCVTAAGRRRPRPDLVAHLRRVLAASDDWGRSLPELAAYWRAVGAGAFGQYVAFRWGAPVADGKPGAALLPVAHPDPVRLEDLVGYEVPRRQVVENTERFVSGRPAHHLLLYGPRGTGKSATVKALGHAFASQGLRLVELPLARVHELPQLLGVVRRQPQRFVILLDDLSFEPGDPAVKELKVALEGTVEAWPVNVRLYATSNRRHVVREERDGPAFRVQDEIHEQISLADRFGVTVLFQAADQELYLRVVEGLLRQSGVRVVENGVPAGDQAAGNGPARTDPAGHMAPAGPTVDRRTLAREALQWALWNNERSPRTAAQFVQEWLGREGTPAAAAAAPSRLDTGTPGALR